MRKSLTPCVLVFALFFLLFSGCAVGDAAETGVSETTAPPSSPTTAESTAPPDTQPSPDGGLEFDYITAENPYKLENEDYIERFGYFVISSKEAFAQRYSGKDGPAVQMATEYFTDEFFEKYVVIILSFSLGYPHFIHDLRSVEKLDGGLEVAYNVYSPFWGNAVMSSHTGWLILDKDDYGGGDITVQKNYRYIFEMSYEEYEEEIKEAGLLALEKYSPDWSPPAEPGLRRDWPELAAPGGGLPRDVISFIAEGSLELPTDNLRTELVIVDSRGDFLALFEGKEYGEKARLKALFDDGFFENHIIVAAVTSKIHPCFCMTVDSVSKNNGIIEIVMTERSTAEDAVNRKRFEEMRVPYVFRFQNLIILDRADFSGGQTELKLVLENTVESEFGFEDERARSLAVLEKYES